MTSLSQTSKPTPTSQLLSELLAATPLMIVARAFLGTTAQRSTSAARKPLRTAEQG